MADLSLTSYLDAAKRLVNLAEKLRQVRNSRGYSERDARAVALANCCNLSLTSASLCLLLSPGEGRTTEEDFLALFQLRSGNAQEISDAINRFNRLSFLTLFHFQLDNLLRNLARELKLDHRRPGYYRLLEDFVEQLTTDRRIQILEVLLTPAYIRNSLHANGIYHGYQGSSTSFVIDGVQYGFVNGQPLQCASWGHVIHAFGAAIAAIEEILGTPQVVRLPDPIEDTYAWERATTP